MTKASLQWLLRMVCHYCALTLRRRPYRVECTGSLSTSEVKQHRARLVLGWGTAWEDLWVLSALFCACYGSSLRTKGAAWAPCNAPDPRTIPVLEKGMHGCISPKCTLSQNGYGTDSSSNSNRDSSPAPGRAKVTKRGNGKGNGGDNGKGNGEGKGNGKDNGKGNGEGEGKGKGKDNDNRQDPGNGSRNGKGTGKGNGKGNGKGDEW